MAKVYDAAKQKYHFVLKEKKDIKAPDLYSGQEICILEDWNIPDREIKTYTVYTIKICEDDYYAIPIETFNDAKRMKKLVFCRLISKEKWDEQSR